ncbi:hypothetical protein Hanom_Chr06g00553011 [Helianthus anomalus]
MHRFRKPHRACQRLNRVMQFRSVLAPLVPALLHLLRVRLMLLGHFLFSLGQLVPVLSTECRYLSSLCLNNTLLKCVNLLEVVGWAGWVTGQSNP